MGRDETGRRRSALLHTSIKLARGLASALRDLGPSAFLTCRSGVEDEAAYQQNQKLEETLHLELHSVMEARNAALPAIARLPDDVLRAMFTTATSIDHTTAAYSRSRAPMQFLGVCRRWRQIALETATLWCSIELRGRAPPPEDYAALWLSHAAGPHTPFRAIQRKPVLSPISLFCLEQTKNSPLSIHITVDQGCDAAGAAMMSTEVSKLTGPCHGVHELDIILPDINSVWGRWDNFAITTVIVDFLASVATSLGILSISDLEPDTAFTSLANIELPRLRELSLRETSFPLKSAFSNLATVEVLSLVGYSPLKLTDLASCSRLTELHLHVAVDLHSATPLQPQAGLFLLLNLKSLAITGRAREGAWFLGSLRAPNLRRLTISISEEGPTASEEEVDDPPFLPSAIALLSATNIEHFAFDSFVVDHVLELMTHLPCAEMFSFSVPREWHVARSLPPGERVLQKLLQGEHAVGMTALPLLLHLRHNYAISSRSLPHYLDFLRDLTSQGRSLCTLSFPEWEQEFPSDDEPPQTLEEISELEEGIARLVSNFVVGDWRFDLGSKTWESWSMMK